MTRMKIIAVSTLAAAVAGCASMMATKDDSHEKAVAG